MTTEELNRLISIQLKGFRGDKNISLEKVGEILEVHRETARRYENHPLDMSVDQFLKLLNFYGIEATNFFNLIYGNLPLNDTKNIK